jgi:hypothetical protein
MWHRDAIMGWEDITTSVDTTNNVVCGTANSFSPFAVGEPSSYSGLHVVPYSSALSSVDTDLVVRFEATRSSCWEEAFDHNGIMYPVPLTCDYTWDFGGLGSILGGNAADVIVFSYDNPGTYTATVTVTEPISGLSANDTVIANAVEVEPPPPTADFWTVVNDKTVTIYGDLSAFATPENTIDRIYFYWGDRQHSKVTQSIEDIQTALTNGIEYDYSFGYRDYKIRVVTIDSKRNYIYYTNNEDPDLLVHID